MVMALEKGQRLGPYEIEKSLGAGGMGEVYKARDTRLDRMVAIKVLPEHAAMNADFRARFEREAKTISSLNHPNICTLYDVGHQDGVDFLVMELLMGETLDDRLKRGRLGSEEALEIGAQIAGALDTAHRQGLVHRDLKPSNVFLTKECAKLLDFGLAKIQAEVITGMSEETRTTPITGAGTIVGTLQYMSPEQLEGKDAETRSDIFAFGAMMYEMVTGQRAFSGDSKASLISSIMKDEPRDISELVPSSPPALDRLIRKCLQKDPDKRWQTSGDLRDELEWIASVGSQAEIPAVTSNRRRFSNRLSLALAVFAICVTAFSLVLLLSREKVERQVMRFTIPPVPEAGSMNWPRISPDGSYLAFRSADSSGRNQIWVRPLNSSEAFLLSGTENARRPFWSPDSRYLAFFADNQLKKIPASGGAVQLICDVVGGSDGCWGKNGTIVFDGTFGDHIYRVSALGGVPTGATLINKFAGETSHEWPWFLPNGNHFLFVAHSDSLENPSSEVLLKVGSLSSTETKTLGTIESRAEYCEPGYVLYMRRGFLVARRFDVQALEFSGEPIQLTDSVMKTVGAEGLGAEFSASENSTLIVQKGSNIMQNLLVWFDRNGMAYDTIGVPGKCTQLALSPDNKRLAYALVLPGSSTSDIWIRDLDRGVSSRLTFEAVFKMFPIWSPDGSRIAYTTLSGTKSEIRYRLLTGTDKPVVVYAPDSGFTVAVQWTSTDHLLIAETTDAYASVPEISLISLDNPEQIQKLVSEPFHHIPHGLSPDERLLLYTSNETGHSEIFVRDLHASGAKWQVSPDGGSTAQWRTDGKEIFYMKGEDLMVVPVKMTPGFQPGAAEKLFEIDLNGESTSTIFGYNASIDGERFLINIHLTPQDAGDTRIEAVLNWDAELDE